MIKQILIIFLLISTFASSHSQSRWFKHIPGGLLAQSFIINDTIHSFGMGVEKKSFGDKFFVTYSLTGINGDSISYQIISFDSIENDSLRSTILSGWLSGFSKEGVIYIPINLAFGGKQQRCFLTEIIDKEVHIIDEVTIDTFLTAILCQLPIGDNIIVSGIYSKFIPPLTLRPNTFIRKRSNEGIDTVIKQYFGSSTTLWFVRSIKNNKNSLSDFFVLLEKQWDFIGGAEQWENYLIKMDTSGNEIWRTTVNGNDSINPKGMLFVQKPDGNLIACWLDQLYRPYKKPGFPSYLSQPKDDGTLWFAEINQEGVVLWRKNIRDFLTSVIGPDVRQDLLLERSQVVNNGIVWIGTYWDSYFHNFILKTDFKGNPIWFRDNNLYPDNDNNYGFFIHDISQTSDQGFIITSEYISNPSNLFPNGCQKPTLLKVDSFGCLTEGCEKVSIFEISNNKRHFKVFPNPAADIINIIPEDYDYDGFEVSIFNSLGLTIYKQQHIAHSVIDVSNYPNGIYFIRILKKENYDIFKIVVD